MAPLRPEDGWIGQPLSMMANGLNKGTGDSSKAALSLLAQPLTQGRASETPFFSSETAGRKLNLTGSHRSQFLAKTGHLDLVKSGQFKTGVDNDEPHRVGPFATVRPRDSQDKRLCQS